MNLYKIYEYRDKTSAVRITFFFTCLTLRKFDSKHNLSLLMRMWCDCDVFNLNTVNK